MLCLLGVATLLPQTLYAGDGNHRSDWPLIQERRDERWLLTLDNDAFLHSKRDRDYTGGLGASISGSRARDAGISLDPVVGATERLFGLNYGRFDARRFHTMQFGILAFTPADSDRSDIIEGERPYASLVYLSNSRDHLHAGRNRITQTSFTFGLLGTSVAKSLENVIHTALDVDRSQGWHHQISDGGEPTLRLRYADRRLMTTRVWSPGLRFDLQSSYSVSAGYVTEAAAALSARWGRVRSAWWTLAPDSAEYPIDAMPAAPSGADGSTGKERYLLGGVKLYAQAYNALLQGQFRDSDLTYSFDEIYPVGIEAWGGFQAQLFSNYSLLFVVHYQTPELRTEPGNRDLVWGTLGLMWHF